MRAIIEPHAFSGTIRIPASKSHTIRRLLVAALAEGVSEIEYPLDSLDARSCAAVCRGLGAEITERRAVDRDSPNPADGEGKKLVCWTVRGTGGAGFAPVLDPLDVGNSGTTLYLALAAAALGSAPVMFTGDEQIRGRSAGPLLEALAGLGIRTESAGGCAPITVRGPWRGGRVRLPCPTSQYLSAVLLAAPLAPAGTVTEIDVPLLNERPYIELTLAYLDAQGIGYEKAVDFSFFRVKGGGRYHAVRGPVPADFSSAAFPACAAVSGGGTVTLAGLDPRDTQGDKVYFDYLKTMGCAVDWAGEQSGAWTVTVSRPDPERGGRALRGGVFDLNATPDMLPAMAVTAAYAEGETALVHAANARIKETDRIAVMAAELAKLGVTVQERPDGLLIAGRSGGLAGGALTGHGDHRIVMALAAAALGAAKPVAIDSAESAAVTWPGFLELLGAEFSN
jgi:3-phosphoshikimate 1-carboxyvinyltransferase